MIPERTRRMIQSLEQSSAAFGEPGEDVQKLETHMSWVLLVGSDAYKIKKPVDLGFADFSTLKKRRHFCEEELRINRRLAPELYLDIATVGGSPECPVLGETDQPIEYAVRMQRFSQDALLDRVLQRDGLKPEHIDRLAGDVADFHDQIEVDMDHRIFGGPETVRKSMVDNFAELQQGIEDDETRDRLERLRQWETREFEARKEEFAARKRTGFVRECHGDMHLANMVLRGDVVTVFDAIEFNENLRWIDVLNEVAFLVMDLEHRGRDDYARRFLNMYLEHTGDYTGLGVLPYYLVYRALVRAKVDGIRLRQGSADPEERATLQRELRSYLDLAERYASDAEPRLIITHGVSGSGKTTGTAKLVEALGAVRIRSDVERKRLFELEPRARTNSGINQVLYTTEATEKCYQRLAELAKAVLGTGFTVVVDATFLEREHRDCLRRVAEHLGAAFSILHFHADEETLVRRVRHRSQGERDASEADTQVLRNQLQSNTAISEDESAVTVDVNSAEPGWIDRLIRNARNQVTYVST